MTRIPFSQRWKLWLIAWAVALFAAWYTTLIPYVWLFPLGLMEVVGRKQFGHDLDLLWGWFLYLALTIAAMCCRPRVLYFTFYTILCILLALNVIGCHQIHLNFGDVH